MLWMTLLLLIWASALSCWICEREKQKCFLSGTIVILQSSPHHPPRLCPWLHLPGTWSQCTLWMGALGYTRKIRKWCTVDKQVLVLECCWLCLAWVSGWLLLTALGPFNYWCLSSLARSSRCPVLLIAFSTSPHSHYNTLLMAVSWPH